MAGNIATPGTAVVSRAAAVLFTFDDQHRRQRLTEIASRATLPVPTTYRLLRDLVAAGALVKRANGEYTVGRRLWEIGLLAPVQSLSEVCSPFLIDIHAATGATVHLAIRERTNVLYLDRVSGRTSVPIVSTVGSRLPMHATGVGKVLLAHAAPEILEHVLQSLPRMTPHTITDPRLLRRQLSRVRLDGFATTADEMSLGAASLAVPIKAGPERDVVAAIGVVVPSLRRDRARLLSALQVAALGIARSL